MLSSKYPGLTEEDIILFVLNYNYSHQKTIIHNIFLQHIINITSECLYQMLKPNNLLSKFLLSKLKLKRNKVT